MILLYMQLDLQVVIIKKVIPLDEAIQLSREFIKKPVHFYRVTKTSYRFRNIPKVRFEPGTFRTKKINNHISLVYGKLKE